MWTLSRRPYLFLLPHPLFLFLICAWFLIWNLIVLGLFFGWFVFFVHQMDTACSQLAGFLLLICANSLDFLDGNLLYVQASLQTVRDHWIICSQKLLRKQRWKGNKQESHVWNQSWVCGFMQNVVLVNLKCMVCTPFCKSQLRNPMLSVLSNFWMR